MKFSISIIAGVLASANASVNIKFGNRQLRRGVRTETLLKNAVPFKTRRLDGEAEIDGSYSLSFGKCVDIKTKSEDLFNGNFIDQVQNGNALSLKSYVLFYACQDAYGYGCSEDNSNVYMIDLPTYLSIVGTKEAYQRNEYCEICEENLDFCAANYGANEYENMNDDAMDEDDEEEEEDNEENYYGDEAEEEEDNEEQDADAEEEEDNEEQDEAEEEEENNEEQMEEDQQEDNEEQMEEEQEEDNEEQVEEDQQEDNEEQNEEDQQEEQNENNEDRNEEEGEARKLKQQIDCSKCNELQCFGKYANDDYVVSQTATRDEIDTNVGAWIEEVANCKQTNQYINGQQIYIGPICSDYADTFEIGAFLDEDCTIYTNLASYDTIVAAEEAYYGVDIAQYAINSLKTAFYEPISCESVEFAEDEEDEEENEMNDYCNQLFQQDIINFNQCAANDDEEQQDEGDDAYNWYNYDLEDADELDQVCAKIVSFAGEYSNYYNSASTGSVHTRDRQGNLVSGQSTKSLSVGAIVAIVLACIFVVGMAACLLKPKRKVTNPDLHQPVYRKNGISNLLSPRKAPAIHEPVYRGHLD